MYTIGGREQNLKSDEPLFWVRKISIYSNATPVQVIDGKQEQFKKRAPSDLRMTEQSEKSVYVRSAVENTFNCTYEGKKTLVYAFAIMAPEKAITAEGGNGFV